MTEKNFIDNIHSQKQTNPVYYGYNRKKSIFPNRFSGVKAAAMSRGVKQKQISHFVNRCGFEKREILGKHFLLLYYRAGGGPCAKNRVPRTGRLYAV